MLERLGLCGGAGNRIGRAALAAAVLLALLLGRRGALIEEIHAAAPSPAAPDFAAIDRFVQAQMRAHNIPGVAYAVTQGDQLLHSRGFGRAGPDRPMMADTPLDIGSITKSFTALAIMQLVEEGKVELDAPVQRYLPWFTVADPGASGAITVRHLLYQTSGLAETGYTASLPATAGLTEAVQGLRAAVPVAPPGAAFNYFNPNYTTLGLIVQEVSGQPYADYLRQHFFEPLEMARTAVDPQRVASLNPAQGHGVLFGLPLPREAERAAYDLPAGGIVSTVEDMAHYLIAQNQGGRYAGRQIISPAGLAASHEPGVGDAENGYAMGWMVGQLQGPDGQPYPLLHHSGSLPNYRAFAWLLPQQELGIVVLINQNGFLPMLLAYTQIPAGIAAHLVGVSPPAAIGMDILYLGLALAFLLLLLLEARWWRRTLSALRLHRGRQQTLLRAARYLILPALLFFGLPPLLQRLLGRGFNWQLAASMEPTLVLVAGFVTLAGLARAIALTISALRSR